MSDLAGLDLTVKADHLRPGRDYLLAELIGEPDGALLPGFSAADCAPVDTDADAAVVRWNGNGVGVRRIGALAAYPTDSVADRRGWAKSGAVGDDLGAGEAAEAAVRVRFHLVGDGVRFYCFGFRPSGDGRRRRTS